MLDVGFPLLGIYDVACQVLLSRSLSLVKHIHVYATKNICFIVNEPTYNNYWQTNALMKTVTVLLEYDNCKLAAY